MNKVVNHEEWTKERIAFLNKEKEFTKMRDELTKARRELPWKKIEKHYTFVTPNGIQTLESLFDGKSQLFIYHFMLGPNWKAGCPSCSLLADNFNGIEKHLNARDVSFKFISRAPLDQIEAFKKRMGWTMDWYSSNNSDFNFDFQVSFTDEDMETGNTEYNFSKMKFPSTEAPGASCFKKTPEGIFHTYSTYSRGLDMLMGNYHILDIVPDGRNEDALEYPMAWVKHRDLY